MVSVMIEEVRVRHPSKCEAAMGRILRLLLTFLMCSTGVSALKFNQGMLGANMRSGWHSQRLTRLPASYQVTLYDNKEGKPSNERVVELSGEMTLLDALISAEGDAPHSCKAGLCTECAVLAVSGQQNIELEAAILDPDTTAKGFVLSCSARIKGEGVGLLLGVGDAMYEDQFGSFRKDHESYQDGGSNAGNRPGQLDGVFNLNVEA